MNRFIAHNIPKIDLHCHLDGSMSVELTQKLLRCSPSMEIYYIRCWQSSEQFCWCCT